MTVGLEDATGKVVGDRVEAPIGDRLGAAIGDFDGIAEGLKDGKSLGSFEGETLGTSDPGICASASLDGEILGVNDGKSLTTAACISLEGGTVGKLGPTVADEGGRGLVDLEVGRWFDFFGVLELRGLFGFGLGRSDGAVLGTSDGNILGVSDGKTLGMSDKSAGIVCTNPLLGENEGTIDGASEPLRPLGTIDGTKLGRSEAREFELGETDGIKLGKSD